MLRTPGRTLQDHADTLAATFAHAAAICHNEIELRLQVEPVIRTALRELYGFTWDQIRSERLNVAGRYDTSYGGAIVEYEWRMGSSRRRHGAEQALAYLAAERDRLGHEHAFTAIVTDGREWGFLLSDVLADEQLNLFNAIPADPESRFVWQGHSPAACRRFLELVSTHKKMPVSGESLSDRFGRGSELARQAVSLFIQAITNRDSHSLADTLFAEWRRSLEVAYGTLDDASAATKEVREAYRIAYDATLGTTLFALHSYFALVARLVALEVLAIAAQDLSARPSLWVAYTDRELVARLRLFESGSLPANIEVANLLEGDVFSWYLDGIEGDVTLLNNIREICAALDGFAFPRLAFGPTPTRDLFRDLYQRLTTRELRRALGEFLTPSWLATATLEAARRNGANIEKGRLLDCTCGTGTFLAPVLSARLRSLRLKLEREPRADEIQAVLNSVVGIDINPVAIVAARMNYLIALGDLATTHHLYLPIWMADSVLLPEAPPLQMEIRRTELLHARYVELWTSLDEPFFIPVECLDQRRLATVAELLHLAVQRGDSAVDFLDNLASKVGPESPSPIADDLDGWTNACRVLAFLYSRLLQLHAEGRDGVWADIIKNRFAPLFLGKFEVVVGNPPWLTFTRLPENWRRRAEPIWKNYGMFEAPRAPGVEESRSLHTSDLSVLVTAVALDRYLVPGGVLSFVVPKALINADPGNRAFRQYRLTSLRSSGSTREVELPFRLCEIMDFSEVHPFSPDASNSPIVMVIRSNAETIFPVRGSRWYRAAQGVSVRDEPWDKVSRAFLRHEEVQWAPISTYAASPLAWWLGSERPFRGEPSQYLYGKGIDTRGANGILFVEIKASVDDQGMVVVANQPALGRDKELEARGSQRGRVEADLVVPVIRGRDVEAFSARASIYLLLGHEPTDRRTLLSAKSLARRYPEARSFLANFKDKLKARRHYMSFKPDENCWWQVQGAEHMDRGFLVCVGEITNPPVAAVVGEIWDPELGRRVLPVPEHKVVFYNTAVCDEAHFLAGMINSEPMQSLIRRYANFIAVSPATLRYLPIPSFDGSRPLHKEMASLSEEAHRDMRNGQEFTIERLNSVARDILSPESESSTSEIHASREKRP